MPEEDKSGGGGGSGGGSGGDDKKPNGDKGVSCHSGAEYTSNNVDAL